MEDLSFKEGTVATQRSESFEIPTPIVRSSSSNNNTKKNNNNSNNKVSKSKGKSNNDENGIHHQLPFLNKNDQDDDVNNNNTITERRRSLLRGRKSSHPSMTAENVSASSSSSASPWNEKTLRFRKACGRFINNDRLQAFMVFLIITNALMMGIGTFDFVSNNSNIERSFEYVDLVFLSIFTLELILQFIYHGLSLFKDGWLIFDFVIIVLSWSLSGFQIIRAFRVFRALRLITRVENLRNLISALLEVLPKMSAITALLLLIFYIYAVMFTVLFKDMYKRGLTEVDYFSRLDITFFTLLQVMTLDWGNPARQVMKEYTWGWAPFVSFVALSSFMIYNLIIAVVCDAVATIEHDDDEDEDEDESQFLLSQSLLERLESTEQIMKKASERVELLEDQLTSIVTTQRSMEILLDEILMEMRLDQKIKEQGGDSSSGSGDGGDKYQVVVDDDD